MTWTIRLVVIFCKKISIISNLFGFGAGETWPGEIALRIQPLILSSLASQIKKGIILIAGTNGKTTISLMVTTILEKHGDRIINNASGANLLNGVVSSMIRSSDWFGNIQADWGVFEVDENSLPAVIKFIKPKKIALLNLFRDQLDRYGEVDVIVEKWQKVLKNNDLILNADDPAIAYLGKNKKALYFGIEDKKEFLKEKEHATDSTFCPQCGNRLTYEGIFYSHIGHWKCDKCGNLRPKPEISKAISPLPGLYNQYNTLAAVAIAQSLGIKNPEKFLEGFAPAFGRQEEFQINNKKIKVFLSKNPAGFNASLRTALELKAKNILLVLNDRIPDGQDVSWIWDVDFESIPKNTKITVSGDRVYDLALRMQYAEVKSEIVPDLQKALVVSSDMLYVLATYSAMLEVRKILTGKKIL